MRDALDLRPDSVIGQWTLAASLTSLGRGAEALTALDATLMADESADYLRVLRIPALIAAGYTDRAEEGFRALEPRGISYTQ